MGLTILVTPEIQTMSAHISDISIVTHVYTTEKKDSSAVPVPYNFVFIVCRHWTKYALLQYQYYASHRCHKK